MDAHDLKVVGLLALVSFLLGLGFAIFTVADGVSQEQDAAVNKLYERLVPRPAKDVDLTE